MNINKLYPSEYFGELANEQESIAKNDNLKIFDIRGPSSFFLWWPSEGNHVKFTILPAWTWCAVFLVNDEVVRIVCVCRQVVCISYCLPYFLFGYNFSTVVNCAYRFVQIFLNMLYCILTFQTILNQIFSKHAKKVN